MRLWLVFLKSLREQVRNIWVLLLTLAFAPVFVYAYWLFFPESGSTTYQVLVINEDVGVQIDGASYNAGQEAIEALQQVAYENGSPMLNIKQTSNRADIEPILRDRQATAYIIFPPDFSRVLLKARESDDPVAAELVFGGDLTNPYYALAAILATSAVDAYVQTASQRPSLLQYTEAPLGGSGTRTEFEIYVPGILIFAIMMLVFTAAMTVAREVEEGTLKRLAITRLTSFELLGGISLVLVLIGLAAELLAFFTALSLGFQSHGPLWVAILVGALTSLSIIGVGLIVAAFSNTVAQAFVIANFPLGLFMFFSGAIFPINTVPLFEIGGRTIGLYDLLPPRHAVLALNKVMTLGAGFVDVLYEISWLAILSLAYFAMGVWIFKRRHMRPL
jgi:ABC-2 type transport system permease protein